MLIEKPKGVGLYHDNGYKAVIEYPNDMDDIYKNIEENNLIRECKLSIVLDDMIVDMLSNRNCQQRVTENIVRNKKLNISFVFNTQSYSKQTRVSTNNN